MLRHKPEVWRTTVMLEDEQEHEVDVYYQGWRVTSVRDPSTHVDLTRWMTDESAQWLELRLALEASA